MKKALALIMAIAMIASMAAVAMAATAIDPQNNGNAAVKDTVIEGIIWLKRNDAWGSAGTVHFGETVYVRLHDINGQLVTDSDAVKGLTVDAKWTSNGSYVKSVELVKEKVNETGKVYAIAVTTTGSSLEPVTVEGEISVKGKTYFEGVNGADKGSKTIKETFGISIDLAYADGNEQDVITLGDNEKAVFNFETYDPQTADNTIEVRFGELSAVVSPKGMKKVLFAYNDTANEELFDAYVDADLTFINCTAAFRRTATVTVQLLDTEYFYEVVDGQLVEVEGEYDDWTEEFTFKTRSLGNYVISDTELVVEEVVVANPSTGAAA